MESSGIKFNDSFIPYSVLQITAVVVVVGTLIDVVVEVEASKIKKFKWLRKNHGVDRESTYLTATWVFLSQKRKVTHTIYLVQCSLSKFFPELDIHIMIAFFQGLQTAFFKNT